MLKKLEQQLQCAICLDIYKEPKLLQCSHIYCKQCLTCLVVKDLHDGSLTLSCPVCRQKTPILNEGGVNGLKPAFHINHLLEIREDLRNQGPLGKTTAPPEPDAVKCSVFCASHVSKEVELFCDTCEELICLKCAIKGGKHFTHDYNPINEVLEKCKSDISEWLEPVEKQAQLIKKALDDIDQHSNEVMMQKDSLEFSISNAATAVHELIESEKVNLLDNLKKISDEKLEMLTLQKNGLESRFSKLMSCVDSMKSGLKTGIPSHILQMKTPVSILTKELISSFGSDSTQPVTKADVRYVSPEKCFNLLGSVHAMGSCDGKNSSASGAGLVSALVGEKAKIVIHAVNYHSKKCEEPLKNLHCELISTSGLTVKGSVVESDTSSSGDREVEYCPVVSGKHKLHVIISDHPITGSPFPVYVKRTIFESLVTPKLTIKDIDEPWGITVNDRDDEVVASSTSIRCISIFSRSSGALLRVFGGFSSPRGITIDKDSFLYLCNCESHCILKLTLDGKFIASVGSLGRNVLQFCYPKDIAYNPVNDKLYVVDANDRVQVLSPDLSSSGIFGMHGSCPGELNNPHGIACDQSGLIYVADTYNHRIQVFNTDQELVEVFGSRGSKEGGLLDPTSVAIDTDRDIVYVSERKRISIFDTKGIFVATSNQAGKRVTVDNEGLVYVCNTSQNMINVY